MDNLQTEDNLKSKRFPFYGYKILLSGLILYERCNLSRLELKRRITLKMPTVEITKRNY